MFCSDALGSSLLGYRVGVTLAIHLQSFIRAAHSIHLFLGALFARAHCFDQIASVIIHFLLIHVLKLSYENCYVFSAYCKYPSPHISRVRHRDEMLLSRRFNRKRHHPVLQRRARTLLCRVGHMYEQRILSQHLPLPLRSGSCWLHRLRVEVSVPAGVH
jgi:hypothetical protein